MSVKTDLIAAKALIDTPEKWVRYQFEIDGCYCALGAIAEVTTGTSDFDSVFHMAQAERAATALLIHLPAQYGLVSDFNDDPRTTHADIMALFDRAIEAAE